MSSAPKLDSLDRTRLSELRRRLDCDLVRDLAEGDELHFVGGAVRDALLGRPARDLDLAVERRGERLARRLALRLPARLVRLGGDRFASFRLVAEDLVIDLWDRGGASIDADLARRDLSIDAMALPLAPGADLVDPHCGLADLRRRELRATTAAVFQDDPLRVLRLARLAAELEGFAARPETIALARAAAAGLAGVAAERIREELTRLLESPDAAAGLGALEAVGGGWALFGGTGRAAAAAAAAVALDRVIPRLAALGVTVAPRARYLARLAGSALAACPEEASKLLERLAASHRLGRQDVREATRLLALPPLRSDSVAQRRFLHAAGAHWAAALALRTARAEVAEDLAPALAELDRTSGEALRDPKPLLRGLELAELAGVREGPELGALAGALRGAQVDGLISSREEAISWLRTQRTVARPPHPEKEPARPFPRR